MSELSKVTVHPAHYGKRGKGDTVKQFHGSEPCPNGDACFRRPGRGKRKEGSDE